MNKSDFLFYVAAITTAIAGMTHLMLGPNSIGFNVNQSILFIVGGIVQVFWIIPVVRRWGIPWYFVGIGGTLAFIALYFITRIPGNPITGRGGPINSMGAVTEFFQIAFVALTAVIIIYDFKMKKSGVKVRNKNKKHVLILAGIVAVLVVIGLFVLPMTSGQFGGPPNESTIQTNASTSMKCTLTPSLIEVEGTPQQIEGPYFVDGMTERSNITLDTSDNSTQEGIPLSLVVNVYDEDNGACNPVDGARVDIWHANYQGVYSGVQEQDTLSKDFLRGYQITNSNGAASFNTIYPGWYEGRAIHIHVKVRLYEETTKTLEWTSQFYLPDSINDEVHTQSPYKLHGQVKTTNEEDGIFSGPSTDGLVQRDTGQHLILRITQDDQGYHGTFNIVINAKES